MTLGNVNEAPLQLNALGIKDARMSSPVLIDRVVYHYRQEVLRQLYRILGSADFLGNPVRHTTFWFPHYNHINTLSVHSIGWFVHKR